MKKMLFLLLISTCFNLSDLEAQKYFSRNGHISFYSEAPVENIEAHNYQASSIIDFESGDLVFSVLMKGFEFEKALMQEHFNEKYVQSDKFPNSTFKGKVTNIKEVNLKKDGEYKVKIKGDLTIKGITKPVETDGTITVNGNKVSGYAKFPVTVADYEIEIPAIVRDHIAKVVDVKVEIDWEPYETSSK